MLLPAGDGLRAALAARSYRQELIVMSTTSNRMLQTLQAVYNLRKLGIDHVLLISTDKVQCAAVTALEPQVGCVWDTFQLPIVGKDAYIVVKAVPLWHVRCGRPHVPWGAAPPSPPPRARAHPAHLGQRPVANT